MKEQGRSTLSAAASGHILDHLAGLEKIISLEQGLDRKLAIQARRASEGIVECRCTSLACAL